MGLLKHTRQISLLQKATTRIYIYIYTTYIYIYIYTIYYVYIIHEKSMKF